MKPQDKIMLGVGIPLALFDQITKVLVVKSLNLYDSIPVIKGFFNLVHIRNRGAAFGFLNSSSINWQFWLFLVATLFAFGFILRLSRTMPYSKWLALGFGAILSGALGNLIDRLRLREVIDFLDFQFGNYHWPAFNIADICICLGTVLVFIILWRTPNPEKTATEKAHEQTNSCP